MSGERFHLEVRDIGDAALDAAAAMEFVADPGFGGIAFWPIPPTLHRGQ